MVMTQVTGGIDMNKVRVYWTWSGGFTEQSVFIPVSFRDYYFADLISIMSSFGY
jgi:hypothetical protein